MKGLCVFGLYVRLHIASGYAGHRSCATDAGQIMPTYVNLSKVLSKV